MIVADILQYLLLITGSWLVLIAYWLATVALAPGLVERCAARYGTHPVRDTLIGLLIAFPLAVIGTVIAKVAGNGVVNALVIALWLIAGLIALIGSAGLAQRIGAGLVSPLDGIQPWKRVLRGGAVLGLVFLMPLLGWFVLLPWTLVSGFGAVVGCVGARRVPVRVAHAETPDTATVATVIESVR